MNAAHGHRDGDPRAGSWALSGALWLATVTSVAGVGRLLTGADWLVTSAATSALVLGLPALARSWRAHPIVPPLLGLLAAVAAVTLVYLPQNAVLLFLPTPGSVAEAQAVAEEGFSSIAQQGLPATADAGISFLLVGGTLALAWAADLFAFSVRVPASTGVLFATLLGVPAAIDPSDVSWLSLVGAVLAYTLVLATGSALKHPRRRATRASFGPAVAVVAVVVTLAAGIAGSSPGYLRSPLSSGVSGTLFNGSIDPVIALGDDLRRPNPVTVLEYTSGAQTPVYLRVLAIADFAGEAWAPSDPGTGQSVSLDAIAAPDGLGADVARTVDPVQVDILTLRSRWLPVPYPVSSVQGVSDAWRQASEDGSISGLSTTRQGDSYVADSVVVAPSEEQLASADPVGAGFERYLTLPEDVPPIVAETADAVTAGSTTPYDRARALQAYFRSAEFTYSEDTPAAQGYDGDGVGVLADFLAVKAGYCVHFASAMAVMARQEGIPSRLAIGYQPGTFVSTDDSGARYRVSSSDLHAWPELYFAGIGWLPFEPTPSRGSPAAYTLPSAVTGSTDPASPGASSSAPAQSTAPGAAETPTPTATSTSTDAGGATTGRQTPLGPFWLLALAVILLAPVSARAWQRTRRRRAAAGGSVEAVWDEVVAVARDLGVAIDDGDSPRAIEALLAATIAQHGRAVPPDLAQLRSALERERYAAASAERFPWHARAPIVDALRAGSAPGTRVVGALLPRSFVGAAIRRRTAEL